MKPETMDAAPSRAARGDDETTALLDRLLDIAKEQLQGEKQLPASRATDPDELHRELGIGLGRHGHSMDEVADRLRRVLAATPSSASPRFLNQLFGGRDPIATLAEMLTPLVNTSMYTYKVAGPQILVEREILARLADKVGFSQGEGLLCPGGSMSNLVALLIARNEAVASARDEGLGGERLGVYTSEDGHYSIRKNAGILGLGRHNVQDVPTDDRGRMQVDALRQAIRLDRSRGVRPLFVNATAGTTVLGAYDPLRDIAAVARDEGLWMHVDGAWGGSVALCEAHRSLIEGADLADSFAWNPHKMMGVPLACSATLFRRRGLLQKHLNETADYLFQTHDDELNPGTRSLQCGRRNDALKLWASWQLHGDEGFDRRLCHLFDLASEAARLVEADPDLELLVAPQSLNVCFAVPGVASEAVCNHLDRTGRLLIGHGAVAGRSAIRLVIVNPALRHVDLVDILSEIKLAATEVAATTRPQRDDQSV